MLCALSSPFPATISSFAQTGLVFWEMLQFHMVRLLFALRRANSENAQPTKRYPFEGSNEHAIYHDVGILSLFRV